MTTRAAAKSKSKKPLETTLGRAPSYSSDDPIDLSHIRKPIDTSIFGLSQVLALFETATDEVRRYITYECDIMYECRICRTIFRSLANFILHKRNYCRESYNQNDHTNCRNNCQENEFQVMQEDAGMLIKNSKKKQTSRESSPVPPKCDSKSSQSAEIVHPDADPTHPEPTDKKNLSSVLCRLLNKQQSTLITEQCLAEDISSESQGSEKEETKSNVSLQAIGDSTSGVFQTMFRNMIEEHSKMDFMKTEVLEIHDILDNNEAILGLDGRIVTSEAEKSGVLKNNFMCTVCDQKFSTKKTLTYHINYKHNNTRQVYKCTECEDTFANTWGVFRHLYKIHRKTPAQVKRLRNQIHANRIGKNEQSEQKDSSNGKTSCKSSSDPQGKLDENQQWMDDLEGDNDLQRCGGCGRKFERKAALHSHSQFCTKRIAVCNTIKENTAKRVQIEEKLEKVKSSKVATTNIENGTSRARRRKPMIAQRLCRIDYIKETLKAKHTSDNKDSHAPVIQDSQEEIDSYSQISKDDIIRIIHTDERKTNDAVKVPEQNEIVDGKDDCREIEEVVAKETDVIKTNIDTGDASMLELKEIVAKETDGIKSNIGTNDASVLEPKEIAAKETADIKFNITTDDTSLLKPKEIAAKETDSIKSNIGTDDASVLKPKEFVAKETDGIKSNIGTDDASVLEPKEFAAKETDGIKSNIGTDDASVLEPKEFAAKETDGIKSNIGTDDASVLEPKEIAAKETDDMKLGITTDDASMLEPKEIAAKETDSIKPNIGTDDAGMLELKEIAAKETDDIKFNITTDDASMLEPKEIAAKETDGIKSSIGTDNAGMLELKEIAAKETDDIKFNITTDDSNILEPKEIAAKETDGIKSNITTDDASILEPNEIIQHKRCNSRSSNSNDAITSVKLSPTVVDESKSAIETKLDSSDNNIVTGSKSNVVLNLYENNFVPTNESVTVNKDINTLEPIISEEIKPHNVFNQELTTITPVNFKMESRNVVNENTQCSTDIDNAAHKSIIQARCIYLPPNITEDGKRKVDNEAANLQPENVKRKKVENSLESDNKDAEKAVVASTSKIKAKVTLETKSASYIDKEKHACLPCKNIFKSNKSLLKHMAVHFNWYRYQCRSCQFMSYNRSKCDRHAEKVHDAHNDATLTNFVLHIPIWKTVELSTDFRKCCKRSQGQDDKTHNLGNTRPLYKNEKRSATKVQKDLTSESVLDELKMESSTSMARDENSSLPDAQDPSVRKMIMEVIFGTDVGSLSHSDIHTSSVQKPEVSRLEPTSEMKNLLTSKEMQDFADNQDPVEEPSTVLRDNSRPVRNRTVPVQKDFLYDMKHILKPKSAKEKELNSEDSHKESFVKKQKSLKIYTKKSKPKLKRPELFTSTNSGEPPENKTVSSVSQPCAAIDVAQDINMNSKDMVKKHVAGDCV